MPKIIGPLFPDHAPRIVTNLLNFSSDGRVRHEGHVTPAPTPGVATSRVLVKAVDPVTGKIWSGLRTELLALFPDPDNWAAQITARTIGSGRGNWAADEAAYSALAAATRADWIFAADFAGIEAAAIQDTRLALHEVSAARALFHVATGVFRCNTTGQPTQPAADNAIAWSTFLFDQTPVLPDDVMTLDGEPLTFGEDYMTL